MQRQVEFLEQVILRLLAALLFLITVGVFIQVVLRYAAHKSFLWGEELSIFGFVWCIYLGAAVNVHRRTNFAFEFFTDLLPHRARILHRIAVDLTLLGCCAIIMWHGWTFSLLSLKRYSPALGISLFLPSVVVPLASFMMIVAIVLQIAQSTRALLSREM